MLTSHLSRTTRFVSFMEWRGWRVEWRTLDVVHMWCWADMHFNKVNQPQCERSFDEISHSLCAYVFLLVSIFKLQLVQLHFHTMCAFSYDLNL